MKKKMIFIMIISTLSHMGYAALISFQPALSSDHVAISSSIGMLNGKSLETVYDANTGHKESQLEWKIKNLAILKGDISWDAYSFLTLTAQGWTSITSGSGHMDDYDWNIAQQSGWTDHSSHPDTNINYANEYDLNLKGWIFQDNHIKAGIIGGYQETRFSWTATGGTYNYDNGTDTGTFPAGERGIGYRQQFTMPYIGLTGQYRINDFEFNALFKFSDWVKAHDNDEHYKRSLTFREESTDSRFYGASVDAGYYFTPNAKIFADFTYNKYEEGKGSTQVYDNNTGSVESFGGESAGISNSNTVMTAGLLYRF